MMPAIKEKRVRVRCKVGRHNYLAVAGSAYAASEICERCAVPEPRTAFRGSPVFEAIACGYCICQHVVERHEKDGGKCLDCDECPAYRVDFAVAV
jgi:hypothetical protein